MSRKYIIVDLSTFQIMNVYTRDAPAPDIYWEYPLDQYEHVEIPMTLNSEIIRVSKENGKWMFYEDRTKKQMFEQQQLEYLKESVRSKRNVLLQTSDWIVSVPDAPYNEAQKTAWKIYRQKLRDITKTITKYNQSVNWPAPPS